MKKWTLQECNLYEGMLRLAVEKHAGVVDKRGEPYILHPLAVAAMLEDPIDKACALGHDLIEDCGVELDFIRKHYGEEVADTLDALSRREGEKYKDFIQRCKKHERARRVKICDIRHNTALDRMAGLGDHGELVHKRYIPAFEALTEP